MERRDTGTADVLARAGELVTEWGERLGRQPTYCVVTFGCQMNERDSEKLSGVLEAAGMARSDEGADFVLYNTCTVRDSADQRLYGRLGYACGMKKKNPQKKIGLCGCMMQEPAALEKIRTSYRFVDLIFGTHNLCRFPELFCAMLEQPDPVVDIWDKPGRMAEDLPAKRESPFKSGVNIMFGCDNFCSYCIVPYVRGRERSRRPEDILEEVRRLASDGVVEVMLLGQNVNSYGKGLPGEVDFPRLLSMVEQVEGIRRIRFMTSHPKDLSDDLLSVMASSSKICRHLHLPLQSGSTRILKAMNRRYTKEEYLSLADKIRNRVPDISLTTDIIVGFPGETREDAEETIDVIQKAAFDNAFTFLYSRRSGTPAADMEGQVEPALAHENFDRVLSCVQETARKRAMRFQGQVQVALTEQVDAQNPSMLSGRLSGNMIVHFAADASWVGKLVRVRLDVCRGFYYLGTFLGGA